MEGSDSKIKKIILKRRALPADEIDLRIEPAPTDSSVESVGGADDASKYFFEGEVFDQFHRPLRVKGGLERLREIANTPLSPLPPLPRRSSAEREAHAAELQAVAEALAHQIFKLAQRDRETELDIYLSAFNVALAERSCQDSRDILARANEFFTEHYYAPIRERGERPEIYHQIVKRVGHIHAERISKIVFGLDVAANAMHLWELYHGAHADKYARMLDVILDCTEFQVAALREEFLQLPYKDLAKQLYAVFHQNSSDASHMARKTIGKSEVVEHKRVAAYRMRDQQRALRYLLYGRSIEELALVKGFYVELGDQKLPDHELTLEADVRRSFPPVEIERMGRLLSGWSAHEEAEEINRILFAQSSSGRVEDMFSDARDAVDRDYTQGLGPLLRRFKKSRLLRIRESVHSHTMLAYHLIQERVAALSYTKFQATNQALADYYGYELDASLFPSLGLFDPRARAELLYERIGSAFDLYEAIQPLEFLDPRQCLAIQTAYQCLFGTTVGESLEHRMKAIGAKVTQQEFSTVLARYVNGHGRWPLNIDLLACYRESAGGAGIWDHDFVCGEEDHERAAKIGAVLDEDPSNGSLDRQIRESLIGLSTESLHKLERAFYELTDPRTPLLKALEESMSPDAYGSIRLLFTGREIAQTLQRVHDDPLSVIEMRDLPARDIALVRERYQAVYFADPIDSVEQASSQGDTIEKGLYAIGILLKPEVVTVRRILGASKREVAGDVDIIRGVCSGSSLRVMGFERGYDLVFPHLRVYLKFAAARMTLTFSTFAELLLLLEGVEPEITGRLQECFDALDIQLLQEILRSHKDTQRLVEECYDLLYPDKTFRHALKEMAVDPDLINETLLHLEGFCSLTVAKEIHGLTETVTGEELARGVIDILTPHAGSEVNPRIPQDINWMDEMVYQIGLSFRRTYGKGLVVACRQRGVADSHLEEITSRVYGLEICSSARELFTLIKCSKEGTVPPSGAESRICSYLESRGPKYRERLMSAYQSFWSHQPGFSGLLDDMTKFFKDSGSKRKLLAMFLSTNSDRKSVPVGPPEIQ